LFYKSIFDSNQNQAPEKPMKNPAIIQPEVLNIKIITDIP